MAFEDRPAWLRMPEFDRFRSESLYAERECPRGLTMQSLPALITGETVVAGQPSQRNGLRLKRCRNGREAPWSAEPTVFTDAARFGLQPHRRLGTIPIVGYWGGRSVSVGRR